MIHPYDPDALSEQTERAFAELKRFALTVKAEHKRYEAALIKIRNWKGYQNSDRQLSNYERGVNDMLGTLQQIAREALN